MKAKKCDRCGELYELENDFMVTSINQATSSSRTLDLCIDCYEELIRYLTNPNSIVCDVNGGNEDE
jgi:hypothetical protein|nr:MAG TPA: Protein of unknown function (DUF983) [Caudoviricetes sp.]